MPARVLRHGNMLGAIKGAVERGEMRLTVSRPRLARELQESIDGGSVR